MEIQKFKDQLVAFDFDNESVNITDLVNAFNKSEGANKKVNDYLRLKSTKEFIEFLKNQNTGIPVIKKEVGRYGGTYANKIIAYDIAAWLSPEFRLFVYQVFDNAVNKKLKWQQRQLDYFWDKEDQEDLYPKWK